MTSRFLVTARIPDAGLDILREAGDVTVLDALPTPEELTQLLASGDYDAVLTQMADKVTEETLADAKVKGIANYAVGYNNIDVAAAGKRGILVANTPGVLSDATADIAFLLLLAVARRLREADALVRAGEFKGTGPMFMLGHDVTGQTLGLAGFGRIARAMARRALGFGMKVVFSPRPPQEREVPVEELGEFAGKVTQLPWEEVLRTSDYLSLHVPLTEDTRHLIDDDAFAAMKDTAILINTARGPVVDEAALVRALNDGVIAGAGLDVYENEPELAEGLVDAPNTVLLPHIGSATTPVRDKMAVLAAEACVDMARGEQPEHPVTA
ncbi:D-glycerate dehydrogenase [Falsarthrobacter nasiphocae]|uniref:Glyoxylate reductase n=1 Tax=Falsarthrobacter nasiphocae TaxID=189863 RepID=A0AAE4C7Z2_9MICC|nr:D-glycerate dehydrogenase [Falsarthrobacter nasiphocae]MDR6891880.1 glyoxylate reductase [Falsarthrobacter nasiphocae]